MRTRRVFLLYLVIGAAFFASSCGGGGSSSPPPPTQAPAVSLSSTSLNFSPQTMGTTTGTAQTVTLTNTGNASLSITSITSATTEFAETTTCGATVVAGANCTISVTFTPSAAGSRTGSVTITDNATGSPHTVSLAGTGQILVAIQNTVDTSAGVNGQLQQFMATSFQPAEWDNQFFINFPNVTPLTNLGPQHIRIQGVSQAVPMKANSSPRSPRDWDFTILDSVVQPILSAADHSPEFQVAVAPSWMNNSSGQLDIANHLNDFVQYSANLVSYYNTGGFTWGGKLFSRRAHTKSPGGEFSTSTTSTVCPPPNTCSFTTRWCPPWSPSIQPSRFPRWNWRISTPALAIRANNLPTFVLPANRRERTDEYRLCALLFFVQSKRHRHATVQRRGVLYERCQLLLSGVEDCGRTWPTSRFG